MPCWTLCSTGPTQHEIALEKETTLHSYQLSRRAVITAEIMAIVFMGLITLAANRTGVTLLLFPELAALSHDVFTRPAGKWASQPFRLIITPTLTAIAGLLISRATHYGAFQVIGITVISLIVIRLLRSAIGPAISAGLLPLVLSERHWMYPVAIFAGLCGLVCILWVWKLWNRVDVIGERAEAVSIVDTLETQPVDKFWLAHLLGFVFVLALVGQLTGLRFILFPPLVVMAYEVFGHPEVPRWAQQPPLFPLLCFLTAASGLLSYRVLGNTVLGAMVSVAISIGLLRAFRAHMPPALAVSLLPYVIVSPTIWYPVSVAIGTGCLTIWCAVRAHARTSSGRLPATTST